MSTIPSATHSCGITSIVSPRCSCSLNLEELLIDHWPVQNFHCVLGRLKDLTDHWRNRTNDNGSHQNGWRHQTERSICKQARCSITSADVRDLITVGARSGPLVRLRRSGTRGGGAGFVVGMMGHANQVHSHRHVFMLQESTQSTISAVMGCPRDAVGTEAIRKVSKHRGHQKEERTTGA